MGFIDLFLIPLRKHLHHLHPPMLNTDRKRSASRWKNFSVTTQFFLRRDAEKQHEGKRYKPSAFL